MLITAEITVLDAEAARAAVPDLAGVLLDCVARGASVSFMSPLTRQRAEDFWREVAVGVSRGDRILLTARRNGRIVGTVQAVFAGPENQPHRADVAKMLVHGEARRAGIAAALMAAVESAAFEAGKTLLVLDTVTGGDAEKLYARLGWTRVGVIPNFALFPDGRPCPTTYFYKDLGSRGGACS